MVPYFFSKGGDTSTFGTSMFSTRSTPCLPTLPCIKTKPSLPHFASQPTTGRQARARWELLISGTVYVSQVTYYTTTAKWTLPQPNGKGLSVGGARPGLVVMCTGGSAKPTSSAKPELSRTVPTLATLLTPANHQQGDSQGDDNICILRDFDDRIHPASECKVS